MMLILGNASKGSHLEWVGNKQKTWYQSPWRYEYLKWERERKNVMDTTENVKFTFIFTVLMNMGYIVVDMIILK